MALTSEEASALELLEQEFAHVASQFTALVTADTPEAFFIDQGTPLSLAAWRSLADTTFPDGSLIQAIQDAAESGL